MISGIYKITNKLTKQFYIGSSSNLIKRKCHHFSDLKKNKHFNKYLQNAWNKYGEKNFVFEIIEEIEDKNTLIEKEQCWLDKTRCYNRDVGYNIRTRAESNLGRVVSEETKEKLSNALKGRKAWNKGVPLSKKTKSKLSQALKGRKSPNKGKNFSEEHKRKLSESHKGQRPWMKGKKHTEKTKEKIAETLCIFSKKERDFIRSRYLSEKISIRKLAKECNASYSCIRRIVSCI